LFALARHGHSVLNVEQRVNGDPSVDVPLTEQGREEARRLGLQLANVPLDLCVVTRFGRTAATAAEALAGREVRVEVEPLLDDVYVGDLEGWPISDYRAWKAEHTRSDSFPGGESLDDAARRYVRGFRKLLDLRAGFVLVVCHEIPIRYALNALRGSGDLDGPVHEIANAAPFLFDRGALGRAAAEIEALAPHVEDGSSSANA
jgi:2,3-bisphosphoglycerate-dependent phosphoglycerate mutase